VNGQLRRTAQMRSSNLLPLEMRYETETGYNQERGKGDSVECAQNGEKRECRGGKDSRVLLSRG
jgi:hypothetical protein